MHPYFIKCINHWKNRMRWNQTTNHANTLRLHREQLCHCCLIFRVPTSNANISNVHTLWKRVLTYAQMCIGKNFEIAVDLNRSAIKRSILEWPKHAVQSCWAEELEIVSLITTFCRTLVKYFFKFLKNIAKITSSKRISDSSLTVSS